MNTVILYAGRILRAGGFWGRFCTQGCIQVNTNHVDRVIIGELCRCQAVASGARILHPKVYQNNQRFTIDAPPRQPCPPNVGRSKQKAPDV